MTGPATRIRADDDVRGLVSNLIPHLIPVAQKWVLMGTLVSKRGASYPLVDEIDGHISPVESKWVKTPVSNYESPALTIELWAHR